MRTELLHAEQCTNSPGISDAKKSLEHARQRREDKTHLELSRVRKSQHTCQGSERAPDSRTENKAAIEEGWGGRGGADKGALRSRKAKAEGKKFNGNHGR